MQIQGLVSATTDRLKDVYVGVEWRVQVFYLSCSKVWVGGTIGDSGVVCGYF